MRVFPRLSRFTAEALASFAVVSFSVASCAITIGIRSTIVTGSTIHEAYHRRRCSRCSFAIRSPRSGTARTEPRAGPYHGERCLLLPWKVSHSVHHEKATGFKLDGNVAHSRLLEREVGGTVESLLDLLTGLISDLGS